MLAEACSQPAHEGAQARDGGFERVGIDELGVDGVSVALVDGATYGGGAVVVGSVAGEAGGGLDDVAPIVVESADGLTWERAELGPLTGAASMIAVAAGPDGTVLAAGAVNRPDGRREPAVWRRDDGGQWGDPTTPDDLPRDLSVLPRGLAGGPAGFMLAGTRGSHFEIWTSPDGDRWRLSSSGGLRVAPLMVVGDEFVALVGAPDPEAGVDVLASANGGDLANVGEIEDSDLVLVADAAYVNGHYLAVGGDRPSSTDDFSPATWRSDDPSSWSEGPHLEDGSGEESTSGTWATTVATGRDGQLLVTSRGSDVWASGEDEEENEDELPLYPGDLPSNARSPWTALLPDGVPTLFTGDQVFGAGDDGWVDHAAGVIPGPTQLVEVTSVAHGPGGFVAVGLRRQVDAGGGSTIQGLVWRSPDGRTWEALPTEPVLAQTRLRDVTAYKDGFVAVGLSRDEDAPGDGRIFVSADGSGWEAVDGDGLRPPEGGVHQLESVVAYGDGYIATGYGSDGTQVLPLILVSSDGTSVERADVPGPSTGDHITLAACAAGRDALVVGIDQVDTVTAAAWRSRDGVIWDRVRPDSGQLSHLDACSVSPDGATLAAGRVGVAGGDVVVPGVATDASLDLRPLPGGSAGDIATGIAWVDEVPVVIAEPTGAPAAPGLQVWVANGEAALSWTRLTGGALDDLGIRGATSVATGEGVVVVTGNTLTGGAAWTASADDVLDR